MYTYFFPLCVRVFFSLLSHHLLLVFVDAQCDIEDGKLMELVFFSIDD